MSSALEQDAHALARLAADLGDVRWSESAAGIADVALPGPSGRAPTYRDVALAGVAVVLGLAEQDRWEESHEQATFLARHFKGAGAPVSTIAGEGFAGLVASSATSDRHGMHDFAAFVLELYA